VRNLKNLNELLDIIKQALQKIKPSDRICLIHHDDADGNCSAALFSIIINKITQNYPILFPVSGPNNISKNIISKLKTLNPDYVFVLDLSIDPKKINIFKGFILDHHIFNVDEKDVRYLNPRSFEKEDDKVVPTSFMSYKIIEDTFPEEKVAWIAGIGITEDHRVELCKEVFENIKNENSELLSVKSINQVEIENSIFGQLWDMVRSGRMIRRSDGARTAVLALTECKNSPDKFINGLTQNSFAIRRFYEKVRDQTQNCLMNVENTGKFYSKKKVIVYEIQKIGINALTSFISDKIRQKYPEYIVCVIGKDSDNTKKKMSIRLEQSKREEDLVLILNRIKENIPSVKGGGHKSAIGVFIDFDDLDNFFKLFLDLV